MYCRNCGNEVSDKAVMCVACGVPPRAGDRFCYNCKGDTNPNASICMKCGVALRDDVAIPGSGVGDRDWLTTLLLCFFLGGFGVHRFYTRHTATGIIQLLTLGGCGVWALIDFIMIAVGSFRDKNGNLLVRKN